MKYLSKLALRKALGEIYLKREVTKFIRSFLCTSMLIPIMATIMFAQRTGEISGEVVDSVGGAIVGASVTVADSEGLEKKVTTDVSGRFRIVSLVPGQYKLKVFAPNFTTFENPKVIVKDVQNKPLNIVLKIEGINEVVDVSNEGQVTTDPDNNASALVLKGEDLKSLPEDPDDLEATLQAMAGGGAGPNGGQIYIDGFEGGNIPPLESIREIRINRDPFSAEFDQMGFGRIEILTKPGSSKWRGSANFSFGDDIFNARNPFSENKASSQRKFYGGYITGPVVKDKASFSLGINNRDISRGANINATVIDPDFNIVPLQEEVTQTSNLFSFNPRLDFGINDKNTLVARYDFQRRTSENVGGGFTLPMRGTQSENSSQAIQLTETAILNSKTVNETRFQYRYDNREVSGDNSTPAINVLGSFNGGGATVGSSFNTEKFWEFQNYTTTSLGKNSEHGIKFGVRLRGRTLTDSSDLNYNGTFNFTGFVPDSPSPYDTDGNGIISSIEQYRAKLLGETDPLFNPSQFSIATGNPLASVSQYDIGLFLKDDWRVSPGLTLSYGLRYENQTNIDDSLNFAPRFAFAYSPGAGGNNPSKTVFRGGMGVFYTRFGENLTLEAERSDGIQQQQYIIDGTNPLIGQAIFDLNGVTNAPTVDQLLVLAPLASTPVLIAEDIQVPYTIQGAFSVEHQLTRSTALSAYYVFSRNYHLIRSRNINAPLCPSGEACPVNDPIALQALRPDPTQGNLYQYESSGFTKDQRLIFRVSTRFSQNFSLFANYFLASAEGNTNGAGGGFFRRGGGGFSTGGFPAYSYDLSDEYSNTLSDVRHTFFLIGSIKAPFGINVRPFIVGRSGVPFDITTGTDLNGDSIFNDRPTFGQLGTACVQNGITASWCDVTGYDLDEIIPRNFGRGPGSFTANLSLDRTFGFGSISSGDVGQPVGRGDGGGGRGRGGGIGGGRGGGRKGGFSGGERKLYNFTLGVRVNNLFNTNNQGSPIGNINSPFFGQPVSTAIGFGGGARSIEFTTRFSW